MKSLVGHMSKEILQQYTHIRIGAKRLVLAVLNFERVPQESLKVDVSGVGSSKPN